MGFAPSFRFGSPFFLGADSSELFTRYDVKDNFTTVKGRHTFKVGGEVLHSRNVQVFPGFFTGRYIFGSAGGKPKSKPGQPEQQPPAQPSGGQ